MLSSTTLFSYSFIALPLAAAFIALQVIVPSHYAEVTGLSLTAIGGIVLLARLWDMVTDPVVGFLSDKTPQRWGRRRSWLLFSIPLIGISSYYLFNPPQDSGSGYLLFWTLAIYIAGTMAVVPMNAWGAELSNDYCERNRVVGWRTGFGLLGILMALSILAILTRGSVDTTLDDSLWGITLLVLIALFFGGILITRVSDNHPIKLPATQLCSVVLLFQKASPFRQLLFSFFSNSLANAIPATLFLFYVSYVLQAASYAGALLFAYFICSVISIPFWVALANRYGKNRTWFYSIFTACALFIWTPFLGEGDIWLYLVIVVGTGFTTGCDLVIPSSMNGDVIEWDEANNGYRRPGLFFALWGTSTKLAFALAIGISFPLLDALGFTANTNNSPEVLSALAWIYGLPCVLFKMLALAGMYNYPITEKNYRAIQQKNLRPPLYELEKI